MDHQGERAVTATVGVQAGKLNVLVTGATGKQGGHLVRELLARGHSIRALTRKPDSPAAAALAQHGVMIVTGNFEDQKSLERAARGVDTVFAMSTPFESGAKTETREGINIVRAASAVGVPHLVYASVAGADRRQAFRISTASSRSRTRSGGRACRSRSSRRSSSWRTFSRTGWPPALPEGRSRWPCRRRVVCNRSRSRISRSSTPSLSNAVSVSSVNESTSRLTR